MARELSTTNRVGLAAGAGARQVVLIGAQRDLSEPVILYATRTAQCEAEVVQQADYTPTCLTPVGPSLPECQMLAVRAALATEDTRIISVDATSGPGAKNRRWTLAQRADFKELVTAAGFSADEVDLRDKGLRMSIWTR